MSLLTGFPIRIGCLPDGCSDDINVFEAAANGAAVASKTVAAVVSSYIAFLSMLAFINESLSWIGGRVGFPELSFEVNGS